MTGKRGRHNKKHPVLTVPLIERRHQHLPDFARPPMSLTTSIRSAWLVRLNLRGAPPRTAYANLRIASSPCIATLQPLILQFRLCDGTVNAAATVIWTEFARLHLRWSTRMERPRNVRRLSMTSKNKSRRISTRATRRWPTETKRRDGLRPRGLSGPRIF